MAVHHPCPGHGLLRGRPSRAAAGLRRHQRIAGVAALGHRLERPAAARLSRIAGDRHWRLRRQLCRVRGESGRPGQHRCRRVFGHCHRQHPRSGAGLLSPARLGEVGRMPGHPPGGRPVRAGRPADVPGRRGGRHRQPDRGRNRPGGLACGRLHHLVDGRCRRHPHPRAPAALLGEPIRAGRARTIGRRDHAVGAGARAGTSAPVRGTPTQRCRTPRPGVSAVAGHGLDRLPLRVARGHSGPAAGYR
ncbi:hypothetical protein D3C80_541900 [compost metagenome]